MYYILYTKDGINTWEVISGEDAMQVRVNELCEELNCGPDDIIVFDEYDELI